MRHQPIAAPPTMRGGTWDWTTRRFLAAVVAIWAASVPVLIALHAHAIAISQYPDPDDELRLLEVRDWLGGQSFWDVSQHRVNPPLGGPMHWSRIVDAPIAAIELLFRPLLGPALAEKGAAIIVPMLTLLVVLVAIAFIGKRLAGVPAALLAAALAPAALGLTVQIQPLRVDHHGWEIAASLIALAASLSPWRRGGAVAGVAIAIALQISLEQLPFAAALGGVMASRWIVRPDADARARLAGFVTVLAGLEAALFAALHAPATWSIVFCDAISWPHLLALTIVAVGIGGWAHVAPASAVARFIGLAIVAVAAAVAFRLVPPHCGLDPFSALGPLEKRLWLDNVREGLPVWRSGPIGVMGGAGFPLVGLVCAGFAVRDARGREHELWLVYGAMLLAATLVGIFVLRACALSNALALVPVARAMLLCVRRVRRSPLMLVRVVGSAGVVLALSPWTPAVLAAALPDTSVEPPKPGPSDCKTPATYRALATLPPSTFLAPVDFGPALMLNTPHSVLTTGHHRSHAAIATELRTMIGSDLGAERVVRAHRIAYVLACPEMGETSVYKAAAPDGFAAHLVAGRAPAWLIPVRLPGAGGKLWRVLPAQPPAGLPSSRSAGAAVPTSSQIARSADLSPSS